MKKNEILQEIERLNSDLFYGCSHMKDNGKVNLFPEIENKPERTFSFEVNYSLLKRELDKLDADARYTVIKEIVNESSFYEYLKVSNGDSEEEIARYKDYIKMLRYEYLGNYEGEDQKQTVDSVNIPEELNTPEAKKIFEEAIKEGFMNPDYSFNGNGNQKALAAGVMNDTIGLTKDRFYKGKWIKARSWTPFQQLWKVDGLADKWGKIGDYKTNVTDRERIVKTFSKKIYS